MRRRPLPNYLEASKGHQLEPWLANLILREVLDQLEWCEKGGCVHEGRVFRTCPAKVRGSAETAATRSAEISTSAPDRQAAGRGDV
jgi:hypothetical protein